MLLYLTIIDRYSGVVAVLMLVVLIQSIASCQDMILLQLLLPRLKIQ